MMTPTRYIDAPREVRLRVAEELGITESAVNLALNFGRIGGKSKEARTLVLASGEATIMNYLPQCETIHDADGKMTQTFLNGLILIIDKKTGLYRVYAEDNQTPGEELLQGKVQTFPDLNRVQYIVETYREA